MKKERMSTSDEQRERMLITEQIERAQAEAPSKEPTPPVEEGLKRDESTEKVVLSLAPKVSPTPTSNAAAAPIGLKLNPLKPNPLKPGVNPLKRPNVFKAAALSSATPAPTDADKTNGKKREAPMTAAERLIFEEQERKRRRMEKETA